MKRSFLLAACIGAFASPVGAQDYPSKPLTIVVPAAAGGPTDTLTRSLAASMSGPLKQQILIDNSGGAGGIIGINKVAKARADGYTLLLYHVGMSTAPALYRKLPYDTMGDFDFIGQVADIPMMLVARKDFPASSFAEFLKYARANRDKLTYSHAGLGSASNLCGLLLMSSIQAEFTTVPYKGTAPAMTDLLGGRVDVMCDQTVNTVSHVKSGAIKAYGVTTPARLASFPDLATLDEQGLKGFNLVVWNGIFVPRGTPKPAIDTLVSALQAAVQDPQFKARLADLASEPVSVDKATPESLRSLMKSEIDKWTPIIRKAGVFAD